MAAAGATPVLSSLASITPTTVSTVSPSVSGGATTGALGSAGNVGVPLPPSSLGQSLQNIYHDVKHNQLVYHPPRLPLLVAFLIG